jgi:hypothetical protein
MDSPDTVFQQMLADPQLESTLIVCFYTGSTLPPRCAPMPRTPAPPTGTPFDRTFPDVVARARRENPAIRDGAIMTGRSHLTERYTLTGWSFRLFPDSLAITTEANRGSAYNSCLAMSAVATVDFVYLLSGGGLFRFEKGSTLVLTNPS